MTERHVNNGDSPLPTESADLLFADPPFNGQETYDEWDDGLPRQEPVELTRGWLDMVIPLLTPNGSIWINMPDDTAVR